MSGDVLGPKGSLSSRQLVNIVGKVLYLFLKLKTKVIRAVFCMDSTISGVILILPEREVT